MTYSIRFTLVRQPILPRPKRGPRFETVPDEGGLWGARRCAAASITAAIHRRQVALRDAKSDSRAARVMQFARFARLQMRSHALWARVFAGQISAEDPRFAAIEDATRQIVASWSQDAA